MTPIAASLLQTGLTLGPFAHGAAAAINGWDVYHF